MISRTECFSNLKLVFIFFYKFTKSGSTESKYSLSCDDDDCMQQFKTQMWERRGPGNGHPSVKLSDPIFRLV